MKSIRFFIKRLLWTLGKLCRQRSLLAGLAFLCLFLPLTLGTAAQQVLSKGVDFSGIHLVITAPEGDALPQLLERYLGQMQDVRAYCTVEAMEERAALQALEDGSATAVLRLPPDFLQGILDGTNPDVQVVVGGDQPLESLLTLWVGQSLSDLLAAVQAGIYGVLEEYASSPPAGLSRDQVVQGINLKYVNWTLNRNSLFRIREISASGVLPVKEHYALCLLAYFSLALAPLFAPLYRADCMRFQRRLRAVGRSAFGGYAASVLSSALVLLFLLVPGLWVTAGRLSLPLLLTALVWALFGALFGAFCCLLTGSTAGCGVLTFLLSLLWLTLAGGILPPTLLPPVLQKLSVTSPVSWLMKLAGGAMGYDADSHVLLLGAALTVMAAVSLGLYCRHLGERGSEE